MAAKDDRCHCAVCKGCANMPRERGWYMCRPCALGNHDGGICTRPLEHEWRKQPDCLNCGYDLIEHH